MDADKKYKSVVAIIVAYNDFSSVAKCLSELSMQSRAVDEIIIIDNSTMKSVQIEIDSLVRESELACTYVRSGSNIGSAGGFAKGMEIAYANGATWIWLHDHDDYPEHDCLDKLLSMNNGYIRAPLIVDPSSKKILTYFKRMKGLLGYFYPAPRTNSVVDVAGTAGLLIHKDVLNKIGVYDPDFFVGFEDYDYCLKAKNIGFRVHVQKDAAVFHPDHQSKTVSKRPYIEQILGFLPAFWGVLKKDSSRNEYEIRNFIVVSKRYQNIFVFVLQMVVSILLLPIIKISNPQVKMKETFSLYIKSLCAG